MKTQIAICGYGTVGQGVRRVLTENKKEIEERCGLSPEIAYILDLREFPGDPFADRVIRDFIEIETDPDVAVVVETMGGLHPAFEFTARALRAGKSVVTSNKAVVAEYGRELLSIAEESGVLYLFEASCGGGIPIIRPLRTSLCTERIDSISGILNGTTNYILTRMAEEMVPYEQALAEAQAKGYAEKDPTADVEGYDACRKIAILGSIAFGTHIDYRTVPTEGITKITVEDIWDAVRKGEKYRLIAEAKQTPEGISVSVAPRRVSESSPFYSVNGVFNAILVHGNMLGDVFFAGQGAGMDATGSAVSSDVLEALAYANRNEIRSEKKC